MPRMPLQPGCHFHPDRPVSSASENIKLKLMMETLENNLKDEFVLREQLKTINSESLTGEGNINIEAIDRIELTSSDGLIDNYSIYFKNGSEPFIFSVTNGRDGEKGEPGKDFKYEDFTEEQLEALRGPQGEPGRDGLTTAIKVGETVYEHVDGTISLPEFLTEHQSLEEYAKKSDIPSIEGLASEEFVNNAIASIEHPANPTKVSELENDANYTNETKVLELIENNASSKIGVDFTTDITVGRLTAGTEIKADMTIGEIIRRILMCDHNWIDATCTTPKTCSLCGKTEGEALGHIEEIIPAKAATCEETGLTDGVRCSRCGEILVEQQVIPALGHNYTSEVIKSATCTEEGLRRYTCTRCGDTYDEVIPVLAHSQAIREENRIEPDCTNNGSYDKVTYCTVCNEELSRETINLPALGHDYGDWVIIKQPEVGVTGEQQRTCKRCGEVETQIIPALPEPEKPSVPGIPEDSAAGNIIANSVPAYSGTASTGDKEVAFKILDTATAAPTDQGLYVTYNENNEAIATGYQLTMKGNTDMDAQTFALPVGATIIRAWQYDEMGKTWLEYNFPGDYWRPSDIVTKTIGDVTYEYQSYIYNVEDIGDAISNDEYWRFEMGVNS